MPHTRSRQRPAARNARRTPVCLDNSGLRHTAASLAIASGANVKVARQMLGHKSATMTVDLYGHLFDDRLDAVAEAMDSFQTSCGPAADQRPDYRSCHVPRGRRSPVILGAFESAPGGIRTPNLLIRSQVLYPLSYGRECRPTSLQGRPAPSCAGRKAWRRLRDSNPGWAVNPNRISSAAP